MRSQNIRGNAFDTTLQGQRPEDSAEASEGRPSFSPCVCGAKHRYSQCPHLFPDLRPKGWKPNAGIEKRIQKTLAENERIRGNVERAKRWRTA